MGEFWWVNVWMLLIFKNYFKTKWDAFWCSFSFKNLAKYYPKVNLLIFFIKFKFGLIRFKLKKLIKISCFSLGKVEIKEITLSLSHSSSFCYLSLTLSLSVYALMFNDARTEKARCKLRNFNALRAAAVGNTTRRE